MELPGYNTMEPHPHTNEHCSSLRDCVQIEAKILPVLNKQLGCNKSYKHYMNRMKSLRKEYNGYAELFRCSSGFGWDPITKRFTAPDEVWKEYFKGHPNSENMRDNTFEDFEDLQIIFESATARGNNSFGLGDDANAEAFEVENDVQEKEDEIHTENVTETNETTLRASKEKLPSRKRAKPNGDGDASESINPGDRSEKVLTEMIGVSTNIMNLMQQREERHQKEAEEKEAEKRKNNVWDAIKEIPDLEQDICYDAVRNPHDIAHLKRRGNKRCNNLNINPARDRFSLIASPFKSFIFGVS
ncbi:hypothetical protein Bca101_003944 [Brassica carinata]